MRETRRTIPWALVLVVGGGLLCLPSCRDVDPPGTNFDQFSISSSAPPIASRTVRTNNADLIPLRDQLRASTNLHANMLGLVTYFGTGERFNPFDGPRGLHILATGVTRIGSIQALNGEIARLPAGFAALGGGGGDGAPRPDPFGCDDGDGGDGGPTLLDQDANGVPDIIGELTVTPVMSSLEMQWRQPAFGGPIGVNFRLPVRADWRMSDPFTVIFRDGRADAMFDILIAARVCDEDVDGDGTVSPLEVCTSDGATIFEDYREGLVNPSSPSDVVYPRQHLEFSASVATASVDAEQGWSILSCPPTMVALGTILTTFVAGLPLGPLVGGAPIDALVAGFIVCEIIASLAESAVARTLACADRQIEQLVGLLVNPPSFRLPFDAALMAAGADTDGNGGLTLGEVTTALTDPPFDLPMEVAGALAAPRVRARIPINIDATASVDAADGAPAIPAVSVTGAQGAFTDGAILTFARGGTISFSNAEADLGGLNAACSRGEVSSLLCDACAPGGACEAFAVDCSEFCMDGQLVDSIEFAIEPGAVAGLTFEASPVLASILGGAPLFAESLRRFFSNALPPGGRYTGTNDIYPFTGVPVEFGFRIDPDDDHIDSFVVDPVTAMGPDLCPDTFDPSNADDGDGDIFGAVCDVCPGVVSTCEAHTSCSDDGDIDDDMSPNGCDCDRDGDGCPNPGAEVTAGGVVLCADPPSDRTFDERPSIASALDFSGNGIPDDCDPDLDSDGVLNDDDNCPLGDGDAVFVVGLDDNPSQVDSGGTSELGDLCDPLCPGAGAPGCAIGGDGGGGGGGGGGGAMPDVSGLIVAAGIPLGGCVESGAPCNLLWLLECIAATIDDCFGLDELDLVLVTDRGQEIRRLNASVLGFDGAFVGELAAFPDLDGDGLPELVVSSPDSTVCSQDQSQCVAMAGQVALVGSASGTVVEQFGLPLAGRLGASVAVGGRTIAVGAPEALDDQGRAVGAVYLLRQEQGDFRLARTFFGQQAGERFGSTVVLAPGRGPTASFLVGAPLASRPGRPEAGVIRLIDEVAGLVQTFYGPRRRGRMERGIGVLDDFGQLHVVGLLPGAARGSGAVAFFREHHGHAHRVVRGRRGDRLGTAAVAMPAGLGAGDVVVSAPGARRGRGALLQFGMHGRRVGRTVYVGQRLGSGLVVLPDVNGDGVDDLAVGFDYGSPSTAIFTSLNAGHHRRCHGRHCRHCRHPW